MGYVWCDGYVWDMSGVRYANCNETSFRKNSLLALSDLFLPFEYADRTSWEWIRWQEKSVAQVWHTKYGVYRWKEKADAGQQ